ncbi:hypothetical protein [Novosphingobium sp. KN65.2]|uniref:hypothetical protein n=1 Tax=Novosphingobium sp. KN65.2 TaxID=1478134 RepID=UPI0005E11FF0|nr:hypothetical protein [Novosphingobium sp. KN65.2]CDO38367.1 conserved hypothetical protein [Novosphingobium sp. KN65.2]
MTATTPIERVAEVLELAQFRRMPTPLEIGGLEIGALAAFVGKPPSPDLVVIGDTLQQTPGALQQTIEGVGRALDMMGSRRPLTLVVVGPRPDSTALTALARHARVLAVGELADESALANWLAVLLPLTPPKTNAGRAEAAIATLLAEPADPLVQEFVALAAQGKDSVATHLAEAIDELFLPTEPTDEGGTDATSS